MEMALPKDGNEITKAKKGLYLMIQPFLILPGKWFT